MTVNGQNAHIYGFEAKLRAAHEFPAGSTGRFAINANYGYSNSHREGLPLRLDQPRTIDQPTNTWRISPSYDKNRLSPASVLPTTARASSSTATSRRSGCRLRCQRPCPTGPSGDIWTLPHYQVDVQASYRIWRGLSAKVVGLNLNNEVFGYYQGSTQFVNQREYYKPTYTGGLRYTFEGGEK